jgi:hypothetical protein
MSLAISGMNPIVSITGNELIPVAIGGQNFKMTINQLSAYLSALVVPGYTALSGTNTYTGTLAGLTAYSQLLNKNITFNVNANTGASTVNLNSLGVIPFVKFGNVPLEANDFKNNQRIVANYDGTSFQVLSVTDNIGEGN